MVDDKDGTTKYDKFLQEPINHLVGKDTENGKPENRNIKHSVNFMRGEKLAREIGAGNIIEKIAEAKKQKDMVLNANKKPERKMGI